MTFVDTSVWIAFFRRSDEGLVARLGEMLDEDDVALAAPVWVELLAGAAKKELPSLRSALGALPRFYPTRQTWKTLDVWTATIVKKGERFGAMDLLIGAISSENRGRLWSLDADFERLARLKLVALAA